MNRARMRFGIGCGLLAWLLALPMAARGQFNYTTNNGEITITGYTGAGGAVEIPSTTNGLPVTTIGGFAFYSSATVTSVTIPGSVTNMGASAFAYCTSLGIVTIPGGITLLRDLSFYSCTGLTGVYFQGNAPSLGGPNVFFGCTNATVYYPAGNTGWGATFGGLTAAVWTNAPPTGSLQVTIAPGPAVTAGARWRVDGGGWQNSGATVSSLSAGSHTVGFNALAYWNTPPNLSVNIVGGQTAVTNTTYTVTAGLGFVGLGSLLPSGTVGGSYSQTLQVGGGTGSYSWWWSGTTPPGLGISANGVVSGTPTTRGTYSFMVNVTDGLSTVSQPVTLTILAPVLAAGYQHTQALKWDGAVWGWGRNLYGQLGNGSTNATLTAVAGGLSGAVALAAGYDHTLALKPGGTVWAWGWNAHGQLGDGTTSSRATAAQVGGLSGVIAIAAGERHSVALKSDGTVWAWGYNSDGEVGDGTTTRRTAPVQVSGLSGVVAIACGHWHTLALKSDGTIRAWGSNFSGQLGDGTTTERHAPVQAAVPSGMTAVAAGWGHSVVLKNDGTVWAWGNNTDGQLGDGTTTTRATPVQVSGLSGVASIAAGYHHTLALKSAGTVWAWGWNANGQLGNGTTASSATPAQVSGLSGVTAIAAGWNHCVAAKPDGTVWAWGYNLAGALGDGSTSERATPVQVTGLNTLPGGSLQVTLNPAGAVTAGAQWRVDSGAWQNSGVTVTNLAPGSHAVRFNSLLGWTSPTNLAVTVGSFLTTVTNATYTANVNVEFVGMGGLLPFASLGGSYTQALQAAGGTGPYTWSWSGGTPPGLSLSAGGVLSGTPTTPGAYTFNIQVRDSVGYTTNQNVSLAIRNSSIAAGFQHTAALKFNGAIRAWGRNLYGQLGNGATNSSPTVVETGVLDGVIALAAGYDHTLALKPDGTVWAWGWNAYGQLGNGTTSNRAIAAQVSGLANVIAIAAGAYHSVALKSDGTVWAWGHNADGELGDGTTTTRIAPVQVSGVSGGVAIACGVWHTMVLKTDGTIWGWGVNFSGQLGDGTITERHAPVQAAALSGVVAIAAGWGHSVALKSDGTVWAWGNNADGQLGDGTTTTRATPAQASGLSGVTAIAAGYRHTIGLKSDGTVWAWGFNLNGQLGNGVAGSRSTPTQVSGLTAVIAITAGWNHNAAARSDGSVWGWGDNIAGALGDGTLVERSTPVQTVGYNTQPDGSLQIAINPAGAVSAGALWRVDSGAWQGSGVTLTNVVPGSHTVSFGNATDWLPSTNITVAVASLQTTATNATYLTIASAKAQMLSPTNNTVFTSDSVTFNWSGGIRADQYALWFGTASNGYDLAAVITGTNRSQTLSVPVGNRPLYLKLWSFINGAWYNNAYTYTGPSPTKATMTSPAPGGSLSGATVTFNWNAGLGVSQYALWIGSATNGYDLYAAYEVSVLRTLTLPADGRTLYVKLWSLINGSWQSSDYTYRAFLPVKAKFTGLASGATLGASSVTLNWDAGLGASQYALWVGNSPNSYDLYAAYESTNRSRTLTLPSDGRRVYVTLWSQLNGVWKGNTYLFNAHTAPSTRAAIISPADGSLLSSSSVTFNWSAGGGVSQYALWAGTTPGAYDLYAAIEGTNRTRQLTVPMDGNTCYLRLWSMVGGAWECNDYIYQTTLAGGAKAAMLSPASGATNSSASVTYNWSAGTNVTQYAIWAGTTLGAYDLYVAMEGTNLTKTVNSLPSDGGPIYVRLWSLISGTWKFTDYFFTAYLAP